VQVFSKAQPDQYAHWLDRRSLSQNALEDVRCEMLDHESYLDMEMESDQQARIIHRREAQHNSFSRGAILSRQSQSDTRPKVLAELWVLTDDVSFEVTPAAPGDHG